MPGCMLPAAMAAGLVSVSQWGLHAPGPSVAPPPPSDSRAVYGSPLPYREDTTHFSIQWETPAMDLSIVSQVAADMEAAWDALVEDEGWVPPTSSGEYLLTVILDPDLAGTGLTYTESDPAYPAGVPVIYINTDWAWDIPFMSSLCAHEFAHALQFAVRDWYGGGEAESWYWEASAEWQAEIARPEMDTYSWSSQYYASAPHADHHSMGGYHQYGMFLLNAYLDEMVLGSDGFRDIWLDHTDLEWDQEIAQAVGEPAAHIWADFSAAYGLGQLRESALYTPPLTVTGTTPLEGWLGTHYIPLGDVTGGVFLDQGVGAVGRGDAWVVFEEGAEIPSGSGDVWLMVVNPSSEPLYYSYSLGPWEEADTAEPLADDQRDTADEAHGEAEKGCGCAVSQPRAGAWFLIPLLVWRRRASSR